MIDTLDAFLDDVNQSQYGWKDSLVFTYDKTRELIADGIKGDLVECGVGNGVHPACFARACQDAGERRDIRLFDSFEGVPHGLKDKDVEWSKHWGDGSGRLEPTGVAVASLQSVQANLERWGCDVSMFSFFVGWFQSSVPAVASTWAKAKDEGRAEGIAFLRLDGDLYDSTLTCLKYLYPLVVSGGICVLDDYNLDGCRQAFHDYFESISGGMVIDVLPERPAALPYVDKITESGDVWWRKP